MSPALLSCELPQSAPLYHPARLDTASCQTPNNHLIKACSINGWIVTCITLLHGFVFVDQFCSGARTDPKGSLDATTYDDIALSQPGTVAESLTLESPGMNLIRFSPFYCMSSTPGFLSYWVEITIYLRVWE